MKSIYQTNWPIKIFHNIKIKYIFLIIFATYFLQGTVGCSLYQELPSLLYSSTAFHTDNLFITQTNSRITTPTFVSTLTQTLPINTITIIHKRVNLVFHLLDPRKGNPFTNPVNATSFLDLDTMEIGNTPQSDIKYFVTMGSSIWEFLEPINGAELRLRSRGTPEITLEDCIREPKLADETQGNAYKGCYHCAISNQKRVFLIYIEDDTFENSTFTLHLLITTYV